MDFKALDHSVNIIAYRKDNKNYAMCCAWSMMADYDKLLCLLGSQSITGKNIKKGDIIGVSSLQKNQKSIALKLGEGHSGRTDKLEGIDYTLKQSAIVIPGACTEMICEVIEVLHLKEIEEDNLLYLRILSHQETPGSFLHMEDF